MKVSIEHRNYALKVGTCFVRRMNLNKFQVATNEIVCDISARSMRNRRAMVSGGCVCGFNVTRTCNAMLGWWFPGATW